jgi:hypothetical protein
MAEPITYKSVGVDVDAKGEFVDGIAGHMRRTYGPRVIDRHGAFAGLFRLDRNAKFKKNYRKPVLVAGADGVGTKLLVASAMNTFDTIGIDLVAMNVNDCLVMGAEPLFFLDYLAVPKVEKAKLTEIVAGIAAGCRQAGCALLGGETAEMPALYRPGEFDLAGFAVGVVEHDRMITGDSVKAGDAILGLASSGLHSNGYSRSPGTRPAITSSSWARRPGRLCWSRRGSTASPWSPCWKSSAGSGRCTAWPTSRAKRSTATSRGACRPVCRRPSTAGPGRGRRSSRCCSASAVCPTSRCSARSTWASVSC